jgi:hypothetical protein
MRLKLLLLCALAISIVCFGKAQGRDTAPAQSAAGAMKLSGTMECPNAPPVGMAEVGDRPGHAFVLLKSKCTWTKGDVAGMKMTSGEDTGVAEMTSPTASKDMGYGVASLDNGDKVFVKYQGTGTYKAGTPPAPTAASGTWAFASGTGKAKGITGKGTYKGAFKPDGSVIWTIEGTYSIPAGK